MLEVVIGRGKNVFGQQQIQQLLKNLELRGTLYLGYPIIASSDQMVVVDSLLTCQEHGVVIIDFGGFDGDSGKVREHQDELYTDLQRKLLQYKPLLHGRNLSVEINVLTFIPDDGAANRYVDVEVVSPRTLVGKLNSFKAIGEDTLKLVNAAIQRVGTIKPTSSDRTFPKPDRAAQLFNRLRRQSRILISGKREQQLKPQTARKELEGSLDPARQSFLL
jgi:hypothetical protein